MGKKKKKKFIDKKKATSFHVVQRTQQDPTYDDPNSSQYVLQPVYTKENQGNPIIPVGFPEELLQYPEDTIDPDPYGWVMDEQPVVGELGHDYDYSRHLRTVGGGTVLENPEVEQLTIRNQDPSLDEKAIPELEEAADYEMPEEANSGEISAAPGVQATQEFFVALEGDEAAKPVEFEEILDDFVLTAMQEPTEQEAKELHAGTKICRPHTHGDFEDEGDEDDGNYGNYDETTEERELREIENRECRPIDDEFEAALLEYDDDDIGELDPTEDDTIHGNIEDVIEYEQELDEFARRKEKHFLPGADKSGLSEAPDDADSLTVAEVVRSKISLQIRQLQEEDDDIQTINTQIDNHFAPVAKEKWDCESIISTYSNLENHPTIIPTVRTNKKKQIKISNKTGIPIGYHPSSNKPEVIPEHDDEEEYEDEDEAGEDLGVKRDKKESKADKKARKTALKAARREQRARKKDLKIMYSQEGTKLKTHMLKQSLANPVVKRLD